MIIGSHVNYQNEQLLGCVKQALSYGANTFMFYTGAPQNTMRKNIDNTLTEEAKKVMIENDINIDNVICHAPYIINLANKDNASSWNFSISFLRQEIDRITRMGVKYIVVHPGNSLKIERNIALKNIADALNLVIDNETKPIILLETMAGKGTECGINIEELKYIYDNINKKENVGFCLDTCHLHDSGVSINEFDKYLDEFNKKIGLNKIKCLHINDSKNEFNSHKDRHANIGYGEIGFDTLMKVIYNELLKDVPKILETPWINELPPYKFEIEMIKKKIFNPDLEKELIEYYK